MLKAACTQGGGPPLQAGMSAQPPADAGLQPPVPAISAATLAALFTIAQGVPVAQPQAQPVVDPADDNLDPMDVTYQAGEDPEAARSALPSGPSGQQRPYQTPTWLQSLEPWPAQPLDRPTEQQVQENLKQALISTFSEARTVNLQKISLDCAVSRSVGHFCYVGGLRWSALGGSEKRAPMLPCPRRNSVM